jgi:hypothetical protein
MRELFLADQSGVGPEVNHDDLAFEFADCLSQIIVLGDAEFDLGVFGLVRGNEGETDCGEGQAAPSHGAKKQMHETFLSVIKSFMGERIIPGILAFIVVEFGPAGKVRFTVGA